MSRTLDNWAKPTTRPKRKRLADVNYGEDDSEKGNVEAKPPKKKHTLAASKAAAKTTTKSTARATSKPSTGAKEATKLYNDTLKALEKGTNALDKKVKSMGGNSESITTSTYAAFEAKPLPAARKLIDLDPKLAFNLLLSLADASHSD